VRETEVDGLGDDITLIAWNGPGAGGSTNER
jgi:hypothetical protein